MLWKAPTGDPLEGEGLRGNEVHDAHAADVKLDPSTDLDDEGFSAAAAVTTVGDGPRPAMQNFKDASTTMRKTSFPYFGGLFHSSLLLPLKY